MYDELTMTASDGTEIAVYRWLPAGEPRAVVQIAHGASEHARRYDRLGRILAEEGYAAYADDHRGHGRTAGTSERAGIAPPDSWNGMVQDELQLTELIASNHPGVPIVLLGHSMGSFIAQDYLTRWGDRLVAAVLSGTSGSPSIEAEGLRERVEAAVEEHGADVPSEAFGMLFADFNDPFVDTAPPGGPTGFEWLSRDPDEVRLYVEDEWCGFALSNGFVASMAAGLDRLWEGEGVDRIPGTLPILIIAGDRDPVGRSGEGVRDLTERYRAAGLDVTEILYPEARHEVFNETNRDEVHRDLLAWLEQKVFAAAR